MTLAHSDPPCFPFAWQNEKNSTGFLDHCEDSVLRQCV